MALEPLRFIHACDLLVDHQLHDVGPLPDDLRRVVQDATVVSFERVVAKCLELRVDFLLLTGGCFCESDRSLRAAVTLRRGFRRLDEQRIQVFVIPGTLDPRPAWREMPYLPHNVTLLTNTEEPVAVLRDGRVIASIGSANLRPSHSTSGVAHAAVTAADGRRSFQIGLATAADVEHLKQARLKHGLDVAPQADGQTGSPGQLPTAANGAGDYVAVCGSESRQTIPLAHGTAHHPGAAQGCRPGQVGPHGCTLVEVDEAGSCRCTFLPTAAVRWEHLTCHFGEQATWDELIELMQQALRRHEPAHTDEAWLIDWTLCGDGDLFRSLQQSAFREELLGLFEQESPLPSRLLRRHRLRCVTNAADSPEHGRTGAGRHDEITAVLLDELHVRDRMTAAALRACLDDSQLPDGAYAQRLKALVDEVSLHEVAEHCHELRGAFQEVGGSLAEPRRYEGTSG